MLVTKNGKVVKGSMDSTKEDILYIWGNDEVDTVALAQIVQSGEWSKLERIDGFFVGVYKNSDKVYLFCDRLGIYPLFYFAAGKEVYAAARIPDLLSTIGSYLPPSKDGILSLLLFGHHLADETVFEGIRRCNGGETIVINNNGQIEERISWKKKHIYQDKSLIGPNELAELFVQEVKKSLGLSDKVLIPLSGGFDSRAVLGAVLECMESGRIRTVTFGGTDTFDFQIGRMVANKAGVKNIAFPITNESLNDNFLRKRAGDYGYSYSAFATVPQEMIGYLSKAVSEGNISIWGVGGDAITGSHLHYSDITLNKCDTFEGFARLLLKKRSTVPVNLVAGCTKLDEGQVIQIVARLIERSLLDKYDKPWQFLDTWDIFVRGRMELVSVLPFNEELWRCPHLDREYFNMMATQCFEEKLHQSAYKRMLGYRYKFLYSLPSKRLGGKSLGKSQGRNLYWRARWQVGRANTFFGRLAGLNIHSVSRNYGKDNWFLKTIEGGRVLRRSIDILSQHGVIQGNLDPTFEIVRRNTQIACRLITLGYAFHR